jgi:hypothetical protein
MRPIGYVLLLLIAVARAFSATRLWGTAALADYVSGREVPDHDGSVSRLDPGSERNQQANGRVHKVVGGLRRPLNRAGATPYYPANSTDLGALAAWWVASSSPRERSTSPPYVDLRYLTSDRAPGFLRSGTRTMATSCPCAASHLLLSEPGGPRSRSRPAKPLQGPRRGRAVKLAREAPGGPEEEVRRQERGRDAITLAMTLRRAVPAPRGREKAVADRIELTVDTAFTDLRQ